MGRAPARKVLYCDSSSFGPALYEIWWPDIYLGGPYGPVKDKMYWPELVRRSEKCVGPAGQCLCRGLLFNTLPSDLRNITNCSSKSFKQVLDTFLKTIPDELQTPGYTYMIRAESNSLIYMTPLHCPTSLNIGRA